MGSITPEPELSLDLRASFTTKTIGDFLRDVSGIGNVIERASKHEDFVKRLEEEMRKIHVFKRELPLCMLLLNDAILYLKEESAKCESPKDVEPVLEEFIPMKIKDCEEKEEEGLNCNNKKEKDCRDKKNWLSSVQLWNTDDNNTSDNNYGNTNDLKLNSNTLTKINEKSHGLETEDPFQGCSNRNAFVRRRAFVPFKPYSGFPLARKEEKDEFSVHGLSFLSPSVKNPKEESICVGNNSGPNSIRAVSGSPSNPQRVGSAQQHHHQAARKQRRCWSPELHRRFVSALHQLGGSQVATPKQIRELMQVDGLTNDEVKSHLQKYRLHKRRVPLGSAIATNQSVAVLGGVWMNQDQYGDSSKASSSQSGSPQGPFQLAPTTGDESMEDDSDAKSEGYSWKSHSQTKERCCI